MGGSFSAVTLALLETPTEEIPPFIPALRDPVGVRAGSPRAAAEFRSAHQQLQLLQKVLDPSSQGLHLPAKGGGTLLPLQVSFIVFGTSR